MEDQEFLVSGDLTFQPFNEEITSESAIKTEDIKDEEDILLFAQLDNLANNISSNNDFQMVQEVEVVDRLHASDEFRNKLPIDLTKFPTTSEAQHESNTSHYVRYKLQDGKHVKIWECGICSKEFTHQYTLMRHLPTHTDERKFQCNTCGKAFRQMSTLSQHRAIHSTERPYICEICQKTFNRVSTLISHRKTHTGVKPHRCHLCTKAFHQKGNLRNHIFTHTNERPYKCDICEKGFNQMSNLMCHKLKAHRRAEAPKYICQICGKCFPKRMGLRHHEQYTHGMLNESVNVPQIPEKLNYMNAIIVDPIKTEAMRLAIESNQTPFALLRPLTGIPVLVRVLPAGDKQMLVPASAEDLKKHSHISITPKSGAADKENIEKPKGKHTGSTVQIKIPVVATVIQQSESGGHMSMAVVSPGPNGELVNQSGMTSTHNDNFVYSSTLTGTETITGSSEDIGDIQLNNVIPSGMMSDVEIEFLDENGRRVGEDEFQQNLKVFKSLDTLYLIRGHELLQQHSTCNIAGTAAQVFLD
ncbi:zinc finger protein 737-like [Anoplophora glabripennis]|uniref:zinc finger protein 737-like n=1 Tax=Anoplophora glabripennis TaxID=217634 RepID=UPI0008756AA9|nr:zinc finger protein 737-like [Anoplophora glabripennis]